MTTTPSQLSLIDLRPLEPLQELAPTSAVGRPLLATLRYPAERSLVKGRRQPSSGGPSTREHPENLDGEQGTSS